MSPADGNTDLVRRTGWEAAAKATRLDGWGSDFGHPDASNTTSRWQNLHRLGFPFE